MSGIGILLRERGALPSAEVVAILRDTMAPEIGRGA